MYFSIILATQSPIYFAEQLFSGWVRRVLCYGVFLNKRQMKPLEKLITLAVSLKVVVGNVKYINIDILVNYKQNNVSVVGEIF